MSFIMFCSPLLFAKHPFVVSVLLMLKVKFVLARYNTFNEYGKTCFLFIFYLLRLLCCSCVSIVDCRVHCCVL